MLEQAQIRYFGFQKVLGKFWVLAMATGTGHGPMASGNIISLYRMQSPCWRIAKSSIQSRAWIKQNTG